jgi:hypothetical protein
MIVTDGDLAPEGLKGFKMDEKYFLAIANEGNGTTNFGSTTLYEVTAVPEPETYAMMLAGLGLLGFESVMRRDYPVVLGTLYLFTLIGLFTKLISDLCYLWVDPRVKFE